MMALGRVSSCQVPWPGVITKEEPPRRAMPAWKDARVRSDGLKNTKPEDLARERLRLRLVLQRLRERQQIENLLAAEIGQIEEALHAEILRQARRSS